MDEPRQIEAGRGREKKSLKFSRLWLRRVMPRVAILAGILFSILVFVNNTSIYRETFVGPLLRALTILTASLTTAYYGFKALRWLKRKLLWRVRRRLVITYLFVGLTPIILLTLLGLLSAFGGTGQGLARIITAQINTTERQTLSSAQGLAESWARLPTSADDRTIQSWLDEHLSVIRAALPGASAAVWRGGNNDDAASVGHKSSAQFVSQPDGNEKTRPLGEETVGLNAPLPDWLRGRAEWSGLAYTEPSDPKEKFGTPSFRAVVRGVANNRPFALLLSVPMNRALVENYRAITGINIRPFFLSALLVKRGDRVEIDLGRKGEASNNAGRDSKDFEDVADEFTKDQFGETVDDSGINYPVALTATNWVSGESRQHLVFLYEWSFALAKRQFFGLGAAGEIWPKLLLAVAVSFLVLELLALFAAAWMTRAVTGTVHKLYQGVEFIKRGDFSHRVHTRSHDQLGELASAFNNMSANIEALLQERVKRERLEREVEIAAEVQAQLFPREVPELLTAEISAECRAARGVAGDYYDYIEIAPGLIALALGDVSGKGVSASLVMSNLQASLRAQTTITAERLSMAGRAAAVSAETGKGGGKIVSLALAEIDGVVARKMTNINRQLCRSTESNRFATLFLALYEDRTRALRYTNAGHNAPVLIRADGRAERLSTGGMMIGAFEWAVYEEASATLEPDDVLLIFSDGICEAQNEAGEEYGEHRLQQFAIEHRMVSADELRNAIFREIDTWSGARERDDDQTLVIVKGSGH